MKYLLFFLLPCALFGSPALDRLMDGNQRYISGNLKHPRRDQLRRDETAYVQKPFACVLTCADSRVAPEIIFDQGIGDLFVVRVAGNVAGALIKESIDFAALALNCSILVILGHERCGAVDAVMGKNTSLIPNIAALIDPAVRKYPKDLRLAIKQNALNQRSLLMRTPSLKEVIQTGQLEIIAGYYDLVTGKVEILTNTIF